MSVIKQFSDFLLDSSTVIVHYNGFGKLKCYTDFAGVTMIVKVDTEAGEEAWTGEADKEILQHMEQTMCEGFIFDPLTKVVGTDRELFITSDRYKIPSFNVGDPIARIKFSTKEWKEIMKFGAIAKDKVHIQVTGNLLSLSAIAPDGLIATQAIVLDDPMPEGKSVYFSIPKQALFQAESVSVQIGSTQIMLDSQDLASMWAIDPNKELFLPEAIPDGAIEISVNKKDLKVLVEANGKIKININKKGMVQLKSTNRKEVLIDIGNPVDVPPRTSFQVMASAVEEGIRLVGTAKLITLALPVGLQYIAMSAAAVRCLLPTVVSATKALTAKEIISPEPVVLESESTTVEVGGSEIEMTVKAVESLPPASGEPTSKQEAIDQLKGATELAKEAIARIPADSGLEAIAKEAIEDTLVKQAQAVLDNETTQSVFSKEDIKKITNAIARAIARIEAIRLNLQTWELQVTFRN